MRPLNAEISSAPCGIATVEDNTISDTTLNLGNRHAMASKHYSLTSETAMTAGKLEPFLPIVTCRVPLAEKSSMI